MRYLSKQTGGFDTRNAFIRSMDIAHAHDVDTALKNYENAWFKSQRKQYLNEAFKHTSTKSIFWPVHAIYDMLDEIAMNIEPDKYDMKKFAQDIDRLKSKLTLWSSRKKSQSITKEDVQHEIRSFESKYRYECPDTFKSCWMNHGAYTTLSYGIKYEGLILPKCTDADESLALLRKLALEVLADMDHDVDTRLFKLCHALYEMRLNGNLK